MPPGSRHAMPMTAIGFIRALLTAEYLPSPCSAWAGNSTTSHLATLDLPTEIQAKSSIREEIYFISDIRAAGTGFVP
jgi:hypothetical protein